MATFLVTDDFHQISSLNLLELQILTLYFFQRDMKQSNTNAMNMNSTQFQMEVEDQEHNIKPTFQQQQQFFHNNSDMLRQDFDKLLPLPHKIHDSYRYEDSCEIHHQNEPVNISEQSFESYSISLCENNVASMLSKSDFELYLNLEEQISSPNQSISSDQISQPISIKSSPAENKSDFDLKSCDANLITSLPKLRKNNSFQNKKSKLLGSISDNQDEDYIANDQKSYSKQKMKFNAKDRKSKNEQSKAQKCIFALTGYYYLKNFKPFYINRLKTSHTLSSYESQQWFQRLPDAKKVRKLQNIIKQLDKYRMNSKRFRNGHFLNSFEANEQHFIDTFFQALIREVYKIALESIIRAVQNPKDKNKENRLRTLDQIGQNELKQVFDKVLIKSPYYESLLNIQFEKRLWSYFNEL